MTNKQIVSRVMLTLSEQTEQCNEDRYLEVLRLLLEEIAAEICLTEFRVDDMVEDEEGF